MAADLDYKIYLNTDDIRVAHHLARVVSQRGETAVTARGIEENGQAVVEVLISDWRAFPVIKVLETARASARKLNVEVTGGALGEVPLEALLAIVEQALLLFKLPVIAEVETREEHNLPNLPKINGDI